MTVRRVSHAVLRRARRSDRRTRFAEALRPEQKRRLSMKGRKAVVLAAALTSIGARTTSPANAARLKANATTLVIWADSYRKNAVTKIANQYAASRGVTVSVVVKQFGNIQNDLKTVTADTAPDVIVGAHDWTGAMAGDGSVVPLFLRTAVKKQFPAYSLAEMS